MDQELIPTESTTPTEIQTPNIASVPKKIEVIQPVSIDDSITPENMQDLETMPDVENVPTFDMETTNSEVPSVVVDEPIAPEIINPEPIVAPVIPMPISRPMSVGRAMDAVVPESSKVVAPSVAVQTPLEPKPELKKKGNPMKNIITALIVLILIAGAGAGAYLYRDKTANDASAVKDSTIASLNSQIAALKNSASAETTDNTDTSDIACTVKQPATSVIENIKAVVTSGNSAALEGYMASSVDVNLIASAAEGVSTPTQAVKNVTEFLASVTSTWTFSLTPTQLTSLTSGSNSTFFGTDAVIGMSTDGHVISFSFDCNGKISKVLLANNTTSLK